LHAARSREPVANEYRDSRYRDVVRVIANGKRRGRERERERIISVGMTGRPVRFSAGGPHVVATCIPFLLSPYIRVFIRGIQTSAKAGRSFLWRRSSDPGQRRITINKHVGERALRNIACLRPLKLVALAFCGGAPRITG